MKCIAAGCTRQDVAAPMDDTPVCYAHYAELWAHLEAQDESRRNWPENREIIRAWVKAKQRREGEVRHG